MAAGRPFISTPAGGVVNMVTGALRRELDGCRWFDNGVLADANPARFLEGPMVQPVFRVR